jgi:hypothetical protein
MEETLIMRIEGGIRGIRMGTKTPETAGLGGLFTRLKPINEPMYTDLMEKYKTVVAEYNRKNSK